MSKGKAKLCIAALAAAILQVLPCMAKERLDRSDEIAKTPAKAFEYVVSCDHRDGVYA